MIRLAEYAGLFYPSDAELLKNTIEQCYCVDNTGNVESTNRVDCIDSANRLENKNGKIKAHCLVLPHAGYIYSGKVCAKSLEQVSLAKTLILLGPSHKTGTRNYAVWAKGAWASPLGNVPIAESLAEKICHENPYFVENYQAHQQEHSLEVLIPFLQNQNKDLHIIPIVIASLDFIQEAALHLAQVIQKEREAGHDIGIIVSSDMNHFDNEEENRIKDELAIHAFLSGDAQRLYNVVKQHRISMCGVLPAICALLLCDSLGVTKTKFLAYDTSASQSGDTSRVVGYAGMCLYS